MTQLNFFDLLRPTATVIAFPPRRLDSLIRAAAQRVYAAGPGARQAMLNEVGLLQLRYLMAGIAGDRAYALANEFERAVVAELHRLRWLGSRPDPRGVA